MADTADGMMMPEHRHKTLAGRLLRHAGILVLMILPYLLVTTAGALTVAVVSRTSTRLVNAKFAAIIRALKHN